MTTTCLTYEQLQAYSTQTINKVERSHLYMHISSCELCACAVNGFAIIPFASDELVAIHRKIDAKTNATANPLTFSRVLIMIISFVAIACVYIVADRNSKPQYFVETVKNEILTIPTPIENEKKTASQEEVSSVTKTFKKIVRKIQYKKFEENITPVEQLSLIEPLSVRDLGINTSNFEADIKAPDYDANSLYIYDLKICDYNSLYFNFHKKEKDQFFKTHTSASRENKESMNEDLESRETKIPMDKILKQGLLSFKHQQFNEALVSFNLLLKANENDPNAQFYSAMAYYNLNINQKASEQFNRILKNERNAFYPEAQWYLALVAIKSGDKLSAKQQLMKIVLEKGFYSYSAKQKLNTL